MDWKHNSSAENRRLLFEQYRLKYSKKKIDLIVTTDDAALEFAVLNRKELFPNALIVFSGVGSEAARTITARFPGVIGIYEDPDVEGTINLMLRLNPGLKHLYLIYDNTPSVQRTGDEMELTASRINPALEIIHLNNMTFDRLGDYLSTLPDDSAVLMGSYSRDVEGTGMDPQWFVKAFAEKSRAPLYVLFDYLSGNGAVGGNLISGKEMGEEAAKLGVRILAGVKPEELLAPTVYGHSVLDYKQLVRFNLPIDRIPANTTVINQPYSIYDKYKKVLGVTLALFSFLVVYILVLLANIRRRKAAEQEILKNNMELAALYEEIQASQDNLLSQYQELQATQEALIKSEERYKLAVDGINDGLWDWDIAENQFYLSKRGAQILGKPKQAIASLEDFIVWSVYPDEVNRVVSSLRRHLNGESPYFNCEYRLATSSRLKWVLVRGKALTDPSGKPLRMAGSLTDITDRKNKESVIEHLAFHDSLTGLANRAALIKETKDAIEAASRVGCLAAVFYIDLDNFKVVNDELGHAVGDRVLAEIARKLSGISEDTHFLARMGGDEFVLLVTKVAGKDQLEKHAAKILHLFATPLRLENNSFYLTASVGIAVFPDDGTSIGQLFINADLAMYKAKATGKNRFVFYDQTMAEDAQRKILMERNLRQAITDREFKLLYQPLICLKTGRISGFEALLRWNSKDYGVILPGDFISLAEETGLIVPIGEWVLTTACRFIAKLSQHRKDNLTVSVNISVAQLTQGNFADMVKHTIKEAGVRADQLALEITESTLMESFESTVEKLTELRNYGVRIYLDDFGTGYSSLKYLEKLPIDVVKIDKTFIDDLNDAAEQKVLAGLIVELSNNIGLKTVAEGVETQSQLEKLRELNCTMVQGYLYSRPVPEEETYLLLQNLNQPE
jgi:diguanylate cyclase (GGDEF)-like protein/PAS domain S-box-containing protein